MCVTCMDFKSSVYQELKVELLRTEEENEEKIKENQKQSQLITWIEW